MAKNKISEWDSNPANNTDVAGVDIAEGCAPSGINNAIRQMMAQIKDFVTGADAENFTVGGNLTITGTNSTAPTQSFGTNNTTIATTAFVQAALQALHPVGSIYIAVIATNPNTLFGFGTWVAFGTGRTLVGIDPGNGAFDTPEETGGSKDSVVVSHTHTANVTDPGHSHNTGSLYFQGSGGSRTGVGGGNFSSQSTVNTDSNTTGITVDISTEGSSATNANLPPYIVVYMWKRTA